MIDLNKIKERIISIIRYEGPLLPIQISRKLEKDTIFAGAVLSELVKEKVILVTHAKIGGSPVYYVSGQETKLSMLYNYLPTKEKEAYEKLRQNQILRDRDCEPGIRVALRSIKDFSIALEMNSELYWRWHLTSENEAKTLISESSITKTIEKRENIKKEERLTEEIKPNQITIKNTEDEFLNRVTQYLKEKQIQTSEITVIKKRRETEGRIMVNSDLGILEFLVVAKNKKMINEGDVSLVNDRGKRHKLPVLFLSNGEMNKKCTKYLEENLKGRIIFRKI